MTHSLPPTPADLAAMWADLAGEPSPSDVDVVAEARRAAYPSDAAFDQAEADRLLADLEALNERMALRAERDAEYRADLAEARTPLDAYWAGSAFTSAVRDARAGRIHTVGVSS